MRRTLITLTTTALAALGAATTAHAAGGLSVSPAILESTAKVGQVGSMTLSNTSSQPLRITVTPRPWLQARSGVVSPNRRRSLVKQVRVSARSFTLAPGARRALTVHLLKTPRSGSLFGNVEVVGLPPRKAKKRSSVVAAYRLVGSLRLKPPASKRRVRLTGGTVRVKGDAVLLAARNAGNTVEPVTGTAVIKGARGTRTVAVPEQRIIPGATVDFRLAARATLPKGVYTATVTLDQGGRSAMRVTRRFRVR